ncbi:MAG: DUF1573 domain-containing protein [Saprospiraceae bacterium]
MNKFIILLIFISTSCSISKKNNNNSPVNVEKVVLDDSNIIKTSSNLIEFDKKLYQLGKVKKGDKIDFTIGFKNSSDTIIYIDFISTCDCTFVEFPRKGIKPGESNQLFVTFDSTEKNESETTDIDVFLKNRDPKTGSQKYYTIPYSFELVK